VCDNHINNRLVYIPCRAATNTTTARTWRDALRVLRNRADISGGTLTVYEEDDTTAAFTAAISTAAGNPISQVNPT
ncbi:hypothetical protein LCGC14_2396000, partial [marine sediment metagenome]